MNENDKILMTKVHSSMYYQIKNTGIATPVQVLLDLDILSKADLEKWRFGKVDFLERVCKVNLRKLSLVMKFMRSYAKEEDLKTSFTYYKKWGQKKGSKAVKLRFSKSGNEDIEKSYATHFVSKKIKENALKKNT